MYSYIYRGRRGCGVGGTETETNLSWPPPRLSTHRLQPICIIAAKLAGKFTITGSKCLGKGKQHVRIFPNRVWHKLCKSYQRRQYNWQCRENPTGKYANQGSSKPEARSSTGEHICQLDLQGIPDYRSLSIGFVTLDNLRCWQDNRLHMLE